MAHNFYHEKHKRFLKYARILERLNTAVIINRSTNFCRHEVQRVTSGKGYSSQQGTEYPIGTCAGTTAGSPKTSKASQTVLSTHSKRIKYVTVWRERVHTATSDSQRFHILSIFWCQNTQFYCGHVSGFQSTPLRQTVSDADRCW